ncbi:unnamed protein product [Caenorhabditis angaria]|uniref:Uncharacterized protein n=1 Tax=Caenorhabditis angaria TaxID=860376 RepID=A0A9P1IIV3_9PELO|nr:unnamed protein product [Caenorhabditis angaria]
MLRRVFLSTTTRRFKLRSIQTVFEEEYYEEQVYEKAEKKMDKKDMREMGWRTGGENDLSANFRTTAGMSDQHYFVETFVRRLSESSPTGRFLRRFSSPFL